MKEAFLAVSELQKAVQSLLRIGDFAFTITPKSYSFPQQSNRVSPLATAAPNRVSTSPA